MTGKVVPWCVALAIAVCLLGPSPAGGDNPFLDFFNSENLQIPPDYFIGVLLPDSIPALTLPDTIAPADATYLQGDNRVISVTIDGYTRGYPLPVMNWHEVMNDVLAGVSIGATYCPLCDSVTVFDRRVDDQTTLEFGTSGGLYSSNLVMYDRTDFALWSQVRMTAISGPHAGDSLRHLPFEILRFDTWRAAYPDATVLSTDTGHVRDYDVDPYEGYLDNDLLFFPITVEDDRLPRKDRVIGVKGDGVNRAYPLAELRKLPGGRLEQPFPGGDLILQAGPAADEISVVSFPEGFLVTHTLWFAWAAIHEGPEIFTAPDPVVPGDTNFDGLVNDDDLSVMLSRWGQDATWPKGNFNGDHVVNDDDLSLLLANWTAAGAAAPEPACGVLILFGLRVVLRRRPAGEPTG